MKLRTRPLPNTNKSRILVEVLPWKEKWEVGICTYWRESIGGERRILTDRYCRSFATVQELKDYAKMMIEGERG